MVLIISSRSAVYQMNGKLDILTASFASTPTNIQMIRDGLVPSPPPYQRFAQTATALPVVRAQRELWNGDSTQLKDSHVNDVQSRLRIKTSLQSIDAGLGVVTFRSTAVEIACYGEEENSDKSYTKKTFTINFLWRYASCRRGVRLSTNNTFDSWSFNTIRTRPSESLIFKLCKSGDAFDVDDLMRYGNASVFDADPDGTTPLHVSRIV
jgi:hypothetical protein